MKLGGLVHKMGFDKTEVPMTVDHIKFLSNPSHQTNMYLMNSYAYYHHKPITMLEFRLQMVEKLDIPGKNIFYSINV